METKPDPNVTARDMLAAGLPIPEIAMKTGLPETTVKHIGSWLKGAQGQQYIALSRQFRQADAKNVVPPVGVGASGSGQQQPPPPPPPQEQVFPHPITGEPMRLVSTGEAVEVEDQMGQSYIMTQMQDKDRGNPLAVRISPWTLIWYQVMDAEARKKGVKDAQGNAVGYTGGVTQFIEDTIKAYMKMNGKRFTYLSEVD